MIQHTHGCSNNTKEQPEKTETTIKQLQCREC